MKWGQDDGKVGGMFDGNDESMITNRERELQVWMLSKLLHYKKIKRKIKIKNKFTVYGDEHKKRFNPDCSTNPVVMLSPLRL